MDRKKLYSPRVSESLLESACNDVLEHIASFLDPGCHTPLSRTCKRLRVFTTKYRATGRWYTSNIVKHLAQGVKQKKRRGDFKFRFANPVHAMAVSLAPYPELFLQLVDDYCGENPISLQYSYTSDSTYAVAGLIESLHKGRGDKALRGWNSVQLNHLCNAFEEELNEGDAFCEASESATIHLAIRELLQVSSPGTMRLEQVIETRDNEVFGLRDLSCATFCVYPEPTNVDIYIEDVHISSWQGNYKKACMFVWRYFIDNVIRQPSDHTELRCYCIDEETGEKKYTPRDEQLCRDRINHFLAEYYCGTGTSAFVLIND